MVLKINILLVVLALLLTLPRVLATTDVVPADRAEWPFIVIVSSGITPLCGGSLLNSEWVLTAAHCIDYGRWKMESPDEEEIGVGTIELMPRHKYSNDDFPDNGLSMGSMPTFYATSLVLTHPQLKKYNLSSYYFYAYDIALIKLEDSLPLSAKDLIFPVDLASGECNSFVCSTAGWGIDFVNTAPKDHDEKKNILYRIHLNRTCDDECSLLLQQLYPFRETNALGEVFKDKMCATFQTDRTTPDKGDSGAPLMCDGKQYGVLSMKTNVQDGSAILVFTKLVDYIPWIQQNIRQKKSKGKISPNPDDTKKIKTETTAMAVTTRPTMGHAAGSNKHEHFESGENVEVRAPASSGERINGFCISFHLLFMYFVYYSYNKI